MARISDFRCVYVSESTGVHDRRWLSALEGLGFRTHHVCLSDFESKENFHASLTIVEKQVPVIAGPLKLAMDIPSSISDLNLLSWGFDLQEAPQDLDLTRFSAVIVDSTANEHIARLGGASRVLRIPWGIDITQFSDRGPVMDLGALGIRDDEAIVLSLRAHERRYRVADIIRAFAMTPRDARLVIGNSGSQTNELRDLALELGLDAVFLPTLDESELPVLLRRASVYVTASEVDGTSVTLLQAMACGVPVVASVNAGNADWVHEGTTGFSFPIGDLDRLSQCLDVAIRTGSQFTSQARALIVGRADWHRNVGQLVPLLTRRR